MLNGAEYAPSISFSYGRDNDFIDKQTVQCEFILTTLQNQYMRIQMTHAKNNTSYNSDFDGLFLIKESQVIIEKID